MRNPTIEEAIEKDVKKTFKKIETFEWKHRNLIFLLISVLLAYFILKSNFVNNLLSNSGEFGYFGSFIAGFLFSYGFTAMPSTAALLVLSKNLNPFLMAIVASLGAVISNYIIFRFIGDKVLMSFEEIAGDISKKLKDQIKETERKIKKSKILRRFIPIIAGFIIASPLPNELVAVLFSSAKIRTKQFLIYSYIFQFVGILIIAIIGKAI